MVRLVLGTGMGDQKWTSTMGICGVFFPGWANWGIYRSEVPKHPDLGAKPTKADNMF